MVNKMFRISHFAFLILVFAAIGCKLLKPGLEYDRAAVPEGKTKFSVSEYFLFLPKMAVTLTTEERRQALTRKAERLAAPIWGYDVVDDRNGYLKMMLYGWGDNGYIVLALWTRKDKPDVVGISTSNYDRNIVKGWGNFRFFQFQDHSWQEITGEMLSDPAWKDILSNGPWGCSLPALGTAIVCNEYGPGDAIMLPQPTGKTKTFEWTGETFKLR